MALEEHTTYGCQQSRFTEFIRLRKDIDAISKAGKDDWIDKLTKVFEAERSDLHSGPAPWRMCITYKR
jgi:hypothetical protein